MSVQVAKIYYYAVSLVTVIMIIFFTIQLVYNIVNFVYPQSMTEIAQPERDIRLQLAYEKYGYDLSEKEARKKANEFSAKEVEEYKNKKQQESVKMERNVSLRSILYNILALLVTIPFYLFHFRRARELTVSSGS